MKKLLFSILLFLIIRPEYALSQRLLPDASDGSIEIVCGMDDEGNNVMCNLKDHKCFKCLDTKRNWWTLGIVSSNKEVFKCTTQNLKKSDDCELANNGGISGDSYTKVFFVQGKHTRGKQCIVSNFFVKYSSCYGCIIVKTLISAFIKAGAQAYEVSRSAGSAIVLVCMMIWIAFFVFRNVTAFTSVEPMKLLQEFFVQCFKVVLALIIINSGLGTILHYTMIPILQAGIDMANSISASGNDLTAEFTNGGSND